MSTMSYPGFHKHVNRIYLVIICTLAVGLPILFLTTRKPSLKNVIIIIVCVIISYIVYWLIVRLNCYGTPNTITGIDDLNPNRIYAQPPRSNSSASSRTSTNGGGSNAYNNHPTFASYRLGGLTEIFRRYGGNNGIPNANDDEINGEIEAALRPPPPTYTTALQGAGLPPPYVSSNSSNLVEVNIHNSEIPQMSEFPRRPVPSIPSSSSLRRPVPPIPQQRPSIQSTQSTQSIRSTQSTQSIQSTQYEQYTSQDPPSIISDSYTRRSNLSSSLDSVSQPPKRPVPPIPSSSIDNTAQPPKRPVPPIPSSSFDSTSQPMRRPTPPVPTSSSSTLPPRLYKSTSYEK